MFFHRFIVAFSMLSTATLSLAGNFEVVGSVDEAIYNLTTSPVVLSQTIPVGTQVEFTVTVGDELEPLDATTDFTLTYELTNGLTLITRVAKDYLIGDTMVSQPFGPFRSTTAATPYEVTVLSSNSAHLGVACTGYFVDATPSLHVNQITPVTTAPDGVTATGQIELGYQPSKTLYTQITGVGNQTFTESNVGNRVSTYSIANAAWSGLADGPYVVQVKDRITAAPLSTDPVIATLYTEWNTNEWIDSPLPATTVAIIAEASGTAALEKTAQRFSDLDTAIGGLPNAAAVNTEVDSALVDYGVATDSDVQEAGGSKDIELETSYVSTVAGNEITVAESSVSLINLGRAVRLRNASGQEHIAQLISVDDIERDQITLDTLPSWSLVAGDNVRIYGLAASEAVFAKVAAEAGGGATVQQIVDGMFGTAATDTEFVGDSVMGTIASNHTLIDSHLNIIQGHPDVAYDAQIHSLTAIGESLGNGAVLDAQDDDAYIAVYSSVLAGLNTQLDDVMGNDLPFDTVTDSLHALRNQVDATKVAAEAGGSGGPIEQADVAHRYIVKLSGRSDGVYIGSRPWRLRPGETRLVAIEATELMTQANRLYGMGVPVSGDAAVVTVSSVYGVDHEFGKLRLSVPATATPGSTATVTVPLYPAQDEVIQAEVTVDVR